MATLFISSCGSDIQTKDIEYVADPLNPNRVVSKERADRIGKINLFSSSDTPDIEDFRINKYLWNACLDVLADMPSGVIKPEVGIYETEYTQTDQGIIKIQCRIKGEKVLSKNLDVTLHKRNEQGIHVKTIQENNLKKQMLLRARELKVHNG